jgi:hypothetical protein
LEWLAIRFFLYGFGFGLGFWISVLDFRSLGLLLDANAPVNVSHENIGFMIWEVFLIFFQMACKNNKVQLIERK